MPIPLVAASDIAYWGHFSAAHPTTLPVGGSFQAANGRECLVKFWELDGKWVGIALPFGIVLWFLFLFDHNVSICAFDQSFFTEVGPILVTDSARLAIPLTQTSRISLRLFLARNHNFHRWIDPPSTHLYELSRHHGLSVEEIGRRGANTDTSRSKNDVRSSSLVPVIVVEQRVSNLAPGALCLPL